MDGKDMEDQEIQEYRPSQAERELILSRMLSYVEDITPEGYEELCFTDAARDIAAVTGYDYPAESLRQNLVSQNQKRDKEPRKIRKVERWAVLRQFLVETQYLAEIEHADPDTPRGYEKAAEGAENDGANYLHKLDGKFEGSCEFDDYSEFMTLEIAYSVKKHQLQLSAVVETYSVAAADFVTLNYSGHAIPTRDSCLFELYGAEEGKRLLLALLQTAPALSESGKVDDIAAILYTEILSGALEKKVEPLISNDSASNVESFGIVNYSLTPKAYTPIRYLTRQKVSAMTDDEDGKKVRHRRYFAPFGDNNNDSKARPMGSDKVPLIDRQFIAYFRQRDYEEALALLPEVSDVNVRDSMLGWTALHLAAANNEQSVIRRLEEREDLNYCVRTPDGWLPSDLVPMYEGNSYEDNSWEFGVQLMRKEKQYAKEHGFRLYPVPDIQR